MFIDKIQIAFLFIFIEFLISLICIYSINGALGGLKNSENPI